MSADWVKTLEHEVLLLRGVLEQAHEALRWGDPENAIIRAKTIIEMALSRSAVPRMRNDEATVKLAKARFDRGRIVDESAVYGIDCPNGKCDV